MCVKHNIKDYGHSFMQGQVTKYELDGVKLVGPPKHRPPTSAAFLQPHAHHTAVLYESPQFSRIQFHLID